jgi:ABC-type transport system substrate-binding protein
VDVTIDVQSPAKWAATRNAGWSNGFYYVTHGATDVNYGAYLERYSTLSSAYSYPVMFLPEGWNDLINRILTTSDEAEMVALQKQAVQWHVDECLEIPLWIQSETYVMQPTVHDMGVGVYSAGFNWDVAGVWIEQD